MRDPSYSVIKYLYPKLYRIDDILEDQSYKYPDSIDQSLIVVNKFSLITLERCWPNK